MIKVNNKIETLYRQYFLFSYCLNSWNANFETFSRALKNSNLLYKARFIKITYEAVVGYKYISLERLKSELLCTKK